MSGSEPTPQNDAREPEDEFELDLDLDVDVGPGADAEAQSDPAAQTVEGRQSRDTFDLDLDLDEPTEAAAEPEPVGAPSSQALEVDPSALDISDEAPEGLYDRPDEALAMAGPSEPVAIGDEDLGDRTSGHGASGPGSFPHGAGEGETNGAWDDDGSAGTGAVDADEEYADEGFDADALGIDFEAPAPRRSNRGVVIASGLAGAVAAAVVAVVDPGRAEPEPAGLDPRPTPATVLRSGPPEPTEPVEPARGPAPAPPVAALPVEHVGDGFDLLTPLTVDLDERARLFADLVPAAGDGELAVETGSGTDGASPARAALGRLLTGLFAGGDAAQGGEGASTEEPRTAAVELEVAEGGADGGDLRESRTAELDLLDQVLIPEDTSGVEFVRPEDLADVWLGEDLPPKGADDPRHRLTPRVGPVRLITRLGEVFQGELYAIGGGEISLSNHLGRMSFPARQVDRVERLPMAGEALPVATEAPGRRVRVRVPGGWIHGRVLVQEAGSVTLLTDSGGRVTLPAADVTPLGAQDALPFPSADQAGAGAIVGVPPAEDR